MNGMEIQVIGKVYYTVHLTEEDVEKVREYIKEHKDNLSNFDMEENICDAVYKLWANGDIDLYDNSKAIESEFETEEINWSEFEDRDAEKILGMN